MVIGFYKELEGLSLDHPAVARIWSISTSMSLAASVAVALVDRDLRCQYPAQQLPNLSEPSRDGLY